MTKTVVIGADPAGLSAAYALSKHRCEVTVLDADSKVGGFYRTETCGSHCIDLGDGGFVTDSPLAQQLWNELLPDERLLLGSRAVNVRSLLHYHHRLFEHPLSLTNAIKHIGPIDLSLSTASYIRTWLNAQQTQPTEAETAQDWIRQRFGQHLSRIFFKPYLRSLWGLTADELTQAASKHLIDSTLMKEAWSAVLGRQTARTVQYPTLGTGSVWEHGKALVEQLGSTVSMNTDVVSIEHSQGQVQQIVTSQGNQTTTRSIDHLISSLPLLSLVQALKAPTAVVKAASQLRHRHLITVGLVINQASLFDQQCMYVQQPDVRVSRIQNFKNWSPSMVSDAEKTCLGLSYLCDEADNIFHRNETELIHLASEELIKLGLVLDQHSIESGTVVKTKHAYPVPAVRDLHPLGIVQDYLASFKNLQVVGQNGTHQPSHLAGEMLSGLEAARMLVGYQTRTEQTSSAVLQSLQTMS